MSPSRSEGSERRPLLPRDAAPRPSRSLRSSFPRLGAALLALVGVGFVAIGALGSRSRLLPREVSSTTLFGSRHGDAAPSVSTISVSGTEERRVDEREHMRAMLDACVMHDQAIIPWRVGLPPVAALGDAAEAEEDQETTDAKRVLYRGDPRVLDELRRCPDVDIYLPSEPRGRGACEDGSAFATYLEARLLPQWVLYDTFEAGEGQPSVSYHELCPDTPTLVFSHHWDPQAWPERKRVYLSPSIEAHGLAARHLWRADVVLCKTETCRDRVSMWYKQQGSPRGSSIVLVKQTSVDATQDARRVLEDLGRLAPKDFGERIRFTHIADGSHGRGTPQVLQCWLARPDLPPLDVFIHEGLYSDAIDRDSNIVTRVQDAHNINVAVGRLDAVMRGHVLAESALFLCPSTLEGYGHYMNQARAAGGVIITTDAHPMNELVTSSDMGVFVKTVTRVDPETLLGGDYKGEHGLRMPGGGASDGLGADFGWRDLCDAVDFVLHNTTVRQRELMSAKAQRAFHEDTKFFAQRMLELRELAREHV